MKPDPNLPDRFYDNTRIKEFKTCPRKYFFRHVVHWERQGFSAPLVFGSSWHESMDVIWKLICTDAGQGLTDTDVVEVAYEAFVQKWIEEGGPHPDELDPDRIKDLEPRTPFIAHEMLYEYVALRRKFLEQITLLHIERPFAVPLDPNDDTLFYVGRFDKVFEHRGDIIIGEHKTTSLYRRDGFFRSNFLDSFSPDSQIDGYLYASHSLWGDKAKSVWIDAALVHRSVHDGFTFIPIERQFSQLDAWMWEARAWIDQMEGNWSMLSDVEVDDPYMACFPKNTNSCQDFARNCSYINLCKAWSNPIDHEAPPDFDIRVWSPAERLELEKIGLGADHKKEGA